LVFTTGPCGDTCEGKWDGFYPSLNRARPYFYQCEGGELYYRECQTFQIFNPWTRECGELVIYTYENQFLM